MEPFYVALSTGVFELASLFSHDGDDLLPTESWLRTGSRAALLHRVSGNRFYEQCECVCARVCLRIVWLKWVQGSVARRDHKFNKQRLS